MVDHACKRAGMFLEHERGCEKYLLSRVPKKARFFSTRFFFYAVAGFCEKEKASLDKNGYNHQMFTKMGNSEQGKERMEMEANLYLHLTYVFLLSIPFFVPIFHFSLSVPRSLSLVLATSIGGL